MTLQWTLVRVTPIVASLLLHVVAYGAIAMVPKFIAVRERVLVADLVEPDPTPPAPVVAPPSRPKPVDRRPLTLPKPVQTPMPAAAPPPVEPKIEEPAPPPPPVAQQAPAPATAPAVAAVPRASVPLDAPVATGGDTLPAAAPSAPSPAPAPPAPPVVATPSASTGPSVASLPADGVTQTAVPRGGYQIRPPYPHNARRLGIQGTTLLSVFVSADGRVDDVAVKQSAGHPDLDRAAAEAVRRWRFEPARRGSEPVAMWVLLPFEFRLR
jgi:periplasmic protein TonB